MTNSEVPEDVAEFAGRLFNMAREGDLALVDYVDHGVAVNLTNQDGNSLLMLAAYQGHAELTRQLARRGADVDQLNGRGQSPLAGAIFKKEDEVIDVLLEAGADANAGHPTAIESAKLFGREDLLGRLS